MELLGSQGTFKAVDLPTIAWGDHGEGMDWAVHMVNDIPYRIGRSYQWAGRPHQAREAFRKYLHNRSHGAGSIYDQAQVEQYLTQLSE